MVPKTPRPVAREDPPEADPDARALVAERYRLEERLGRGGMGEVYRALDESTGRVIALKRFAQEREGKNDRLRFRHEFHILAGLVHPRIVEVYDYGLDGETPFYTMELLDGQDFRDIAPTSVERACRLLRDVATALAFLHARRLLHRDVAPRNVRSTSDDRAKLLDFGVLATMGVHDEIVGTLPCIAPESLLGIPVDQRADLFGLGALGYWLLTRRHAYRARSMTDLFDAHKERPAPPSHLVEGVPPALDDLLLSLLASDRMARPGSAAEVIDRLGAIAGLAPAPELDTARGYVQSTTLVGRDREIAVAKRRVARAVAGKGRALVVRGRAGSGKTRLLGEIGLEAKLAGAIVARASSDGGGPYAVIRELGLELAAAAPEEAERTAREHSRRIRQALPDVAEKLGLGKPSRISLAPNVDPREERLAVQAALSDWLLELAVRRPLALLVDDLERADEASAAVLAALAHAARARSLLLVVALRSDESPRASDAVQKIRDESVVLRTRSLTSTDIERLLRETLGDVPNLERLAGWIRAHVGGSPLGCTELLRHLVERDTVRYMEGMWVVPDALAPGDIPLGLWAAMDARVGALSDAARELGQVLAVHGGEVPLERAVAFCPDWPEERTFSALDGLVRNGMLIGGGERFRFRQTGLRDALLRSVSEPLRQELELRAGRALMASGADEPELEAQIGWHLLRGGEKEQGAELLVRAGRRHFDATSFGDSIAPLEAALEVYENDPERLRESVELRCMLVMAGFFQSRALALRHAEPTIAVLEQWSGVTRARRLARFVGPKLGMLLGIVLTGLRYRFTRAGRKTMRPIHAIPLYVRTVLAWCGVAAFSFDTKKLRRSIELVEPLAAINQRDLIGALRFAKNLLNFNLGRLRTLFEVSNVGLAQLEHDGSGNEHEVAAAAGGIRYQRALALVRNGSPAALAEIENLEALPSRVWKVGALQLRALYHLWRGEEQLSRSTWARAELESVRLGSVWQIESIMPTASASAHAVIGDILALKRAIEVLTRLVAEGFCFEGQLALARGEYHRLRGELVASRAAIQLAIDALPEGEGLLRPWAFSALAETLLASGEHDGASEAARHGMSASEDPEYGQAYYFIRCARVLALSRAASGDATGAAASLLELCEKALPLDNPVISGALHEARAHVAMLAGDVAEFERQCGEVERWFRRTNNSVLIARSERLARSGRSHVAASAGGEDVLATVHQERSEAALSMLSQARTPRDRAERALDLLVRGSSAASGHLFVMLRGRLELAASLGGLEPDASMRTSLNRAASAPAPSEPLVFGALESAGERRFRPLVLYARDADRRIPVIAAVLVEANAPLQTPDATLCESIAQSLFDEGDAMTAPSTVTLGLGAALDTRRGGR